MPVRARYRFIASSKLNLPRPGDFRRGICFGSPAFLCLFRCYSVCYRTTLLSSDVANCPTCVLFRRRLHTLAFCRSTQTVRPPHVYLDVRYTGVLLINQSINQKVNLYSASSIKNSQTRHLHISTLKQPCLKSTLELFPGNVTAS